MNIILIYFALKYKGDFNKIFKALKENIPASYESIKNIEKQLINRELDVITILDEDYPEPFKHLHKPPFVLFCQGNKELVKNTDKLTLSGDKIGKHFKEAIEELIIKNSTIVTNCVEDVEIASADYFHKNNEPIIFFSSSGLDNPTMKLKVEGDDKNLIISEYPMGVPTSKKRVLDNNRLIAALSDSLMIFLSKEVKEVSELQAEFEKQKKNITEFVEVKYKELEMEL